MPDKEIAVIANFNVNKDKVGEAEDVLYRLLAPTRIEEGCLYYALYQNPEDITHFTMVERWSNYTTWQAHLNSDHVKNTKKAMGCCLGAEPTVFWTQLVA